MSAITLEIPPDISPEMLRACAKMLRQRADHLDREADTRQGRNEMHGNTLKLFDGYRVAGREAFERHRDGADLDAVSSEIATATGIPVATVLAWAKQARRDIADEDRSARDREIMRLAGRGWTNAQIGARLGISAKTASRAVTRSRKAHGP